MQANVLVWTTYGSHWQEAHMGAFTVTEQESCTFQKHSKIRYFYEQLLLDPHFPPNGSNIIVLCNVSSQSFIWEQPYYVNKISLWQFFKTYMH